MSDHGLEPADLFQIGAEAQRIIEHAEVWAIGPHGAQDQPEWPATLAALLRHLLDQGDIDALLVALEAHAKATAKANQVDEDRRARQETEYAEATRRHAIAVTAKCPHCSAQPGDVCRTSSGATKGIHDHADRLRLAQNHLDQS